MTEPGFFRRHLGLDWFDVAIHAGVTVCGIGFLAGTHAPPPIFPVLAAASMVVLAVRRRNAFNRRGVEGLRSGEMTAIRLEEVEQRLAELEAREARVAELEERLDFAERMLASGQQTNAALPGPDRARAQH